MKELYFIFHTDVDGISVESMSKEELEQALSEEDFEDIGFLANIPDRDPHSWGSSMLIIKGTIVQPKAVETVTKYEVD